MPEPLFIAFRKTYINPLTKIVLYSTILYRTKGGRKTKKTEGGFLISKIKQVSGRIFEKLLAGAGIDGFNGAQGRILYVLWQEDNIPVVALSQRSGLAKTTLTGMLDRMERSGLIRRVSDQSDRRQTRITLTEQARMLNSQYERVSDEMSGIYYKGFSDAEIDTFENALKRVLKNLKESEWLQ